MNKVAPVLCLAIGSYWMYMGITKYKLWVSNGPGGGLFPVIAGLLLIACSIILLRRFLKSQKDSPMEKQTILLIVSAIVTVLASNVIGMIPALGIFMILWLKLYNKRSYRLALSVGGGTALVLYVLFDILLQVPLPMGLLA